MKRVLLVCCTLWIVALFVSCGASNTVNPNPGRNGSFDLTLDQGVGSFTPVLDVSTTSSGATVTITASNANDLAAAYLHLHYDTAQYTPDKVVVGDMLGTGTQVISLALTDVAGEVPVGICQTGNSDAQPVNGSGVLATVHFLAQPFAGSRSASVVPPTNNLNKVTDLEITGQTANSTTLQWTESHPGDTDNNGECNLADLTNIGKNLGDQVNGNLDIILSDCDGNGEVTVAELTTLGKNLGSVIDGYVIYTDAAGTQAYDNGNMVDRASIYDPNNAATKLHPVVYTITVNVGPAGNQFTVSPKSAAAPSAPTPVSEPAEIVIVPGAPDAPMGFTATSSQSIGDGTIQLNWSASTAADVTGYEIERDTVNNPSGFQVVATLSKSATQYFDNGAPGTLNNEAYQYQIRAKDNEGLYSSYAGPANATPFFPAPPSPPINVAAATLPPPANAAVRVTWSPPADASARKFNVYRQGPGDPQFNLVKTTINASVVQFDDTGLTPNTNYDYYVTSLGQTGLESAASPTVTAMSGDIAQIVITGGTIDKTTHHNGGGETAGTITITTDIPADSFSCNGPGVFTPNANGGTWKPNGSTPLGKSTLGIIAHKATAQSSAYNIDVYVTDKAILTQYGEPSATSPAGGHFIDFNDRASVKHPNAPYWPFSNYADGQHVVLFNLWGTWCGPCVAEMPVFNNWANHYDGAFYYVGMNDFNGDTLADAQNFFNSNGYSKLDSYNPWNATLWAQYGEAGFVPLSILFDRDGHARLWQGGGIGANEGPWNIAISHMTGMSPAP